MDKQIDSCSVIYRIVTKLLRKKKPGQHVVCVIFGLNVAHTPHVTDIFIYFSFLFAINIDTFIYIYSICKIPLAKRKYNRNACFTLVPRPFIECIQMYIHIFCVLEIGGEIATVDNFRLACGGCGFCCSHCCCYCSCCWCCCFWEHLPCFLAGVVKMHFKTFMTAGALSNGHKYMLYPPQKYTRPKICSCFHFFFRLFIYFHFWQPSCLCLYKGVAWSVSWPQCCGFACLINMVCPLPFF